jgi:hypothetical protein
MRTEIVDIDDMSLGQLETMIENNPKWRLVTCGQNKISRAYGDPYINNFAIFQNEEDSEDPFFYSSGY